MNGACNVKSFLPRPWGPGERSKVKYHLISISKSSSKICVPNFVCVLTNERYKAYQMGFSFCRLGHAPGGGLWGTWGAQGVNNYFISNMVNWHTKSTGMARNKNQIKFLPYGQTGDLG